MGKKQSEFTQATTLDNAEVSGIQGSGAGSERRFPVALYDARFAAKSHESNTGNPHSVTAAQAGAAPSSHVGAGGTAHVAATQQTNGFQSAVDKVKADNTPINTNAALAGKADAVHTHVGDDVSVSGTQNNAVIIGPGGVLTDGGTTPGGTGTTNITVVESPTGVEIQSSSGTNDTIELATTNNAGVMGPGDFDKLANVPADTNAELAGKEAAGAVATHEASADPHSGVYQRVGITGTGTMPDSISAGESVEVVCTITGAAPTTHAVTFIHVPSTNAKIDRYGVITGTNEATVTLTNYGHTKLTGLSGTITVKAESIS